jgi:HEPN domain-containing protein
VLSLADRSADWVDQALRDLEQAEQSMQAARHQWACFPAQQAWGHTLTQF